MSGYIYRGGFAGYASTISGGNITPAMPTFSVGDLLLLHSGVFSISLGAPAISGWTKLTGNATAKCNVLYGRIALGGDTVGAYQWDASHAVFGGVFAFGGDVTSNLGSIVDGSNEKANVSLGNIQVNSLTPASANDLVLRFGWCAKTSVNNGASFGDWATDSGVYTRAGQVVQNNSNIAGAFWYNQQTTATLTHGDTASLTTTEASNASYQGIVMALTSTAATAVPPNYGGMPDTLPQWDARTQQRAHRQEFWQVPIAITSLPIVNPPPGGKPDTLPPAGRQYPLSCRGDVQGMPATLRGRDQILLPTNWGYRWDSNARRMHTSLRSDSKGMDAGGMTALTTQAPYTEYNWPVPEQRKEWRRSFEHGVPLVLRGLDNLVLPTTKQLTDLPPRGPTRRDHLLEFNQSGLALVQTVQIKPPVSESLPVPEQRRYMRPDQIEGMPLAIRKQLTTRPPAQASTDLPPPRRINSVLNLSELSAGLALNNAVPLPPGKQWDVLPNQRRYQYSIYGIEFFWPEITPIIPPITGPGVMHMGRVILDPARAGETVHLGFDFISGLQAGETVSSGTATAVLWSGVDNNAQSIIGPVTVGSGSILNVQVTPVVVGNIYQIVCKCSTSFGNLLQLAGYFACEPVVP